MDPDEIQIIDNRVRVKNPDLEKALKEHADENIRKAEEKEKARLEKPGLIDAFLNAIDKIKKRKHTENKMDMAKIKANENQK